MKELIIHLGILMALITLISGLWEQYDYTSLLLKPIVIFLIWIGSAFSLNYLFKKINTVNEGKAEREEASGILRDVK